MPKELLATLLSTDLMSSPLVIAIGILGLVALVLLIVYLAKRI